MSVGFQNYPDTFYLVFLPFSMFVVLGDYAVNDEKFNVTFNNFSVILSRLVLLAEETTENKKIADLSQVTDKLDTVAQTFV